MEKIIKNSVVVIFMALLTGCQKDLKTIIAETKEASFVIYTFDEYGSPAGNGSGFFIDSEGTGITNYHVLDKSVKAFLVLNDSSIIEIDKVLASDQRWDIVKFSVKNPDDEEFSYLKISTKKAFAVVI